MYRTPGGCSLIVIRTGKPDVFPAVIGAVKADLHPHDKTVNVPDRHEKTGRFLLKKAVDKKQI